MPGMKNWPLVLCVCLLGTVLSAKVYDHYPIEITSTTVDGRVNVRVINGRSVYGQQRTFMFQCNSDESSCTAPAIGEIYSLVGSDQPYTCDNYELQRKGGETIHVCLDNVN